ncbi:MAG TPA: hypothetical protein VGU25_15895 [Acidobacteriaceae bacterium]|nr:hypothetical protein [Acidobacteriaceae bacterium]
MDRFAGSSPITTFPIFIVLVVVSCVLSGCGGSGGGSGTTPVQQTPTITTNPNVTAKTLYSADSANYTVDMYTANQSGAVSTSATIPISSADLPTAIAGDAAGNLYVGVDTNTGGQVLAFASGATTVSRTITLPNPGNPDSNQVVSMTTDSLGNLYVAGSSVATTSGVTSSVASIFVFSPGATGSAAPLRTISGSATTLLAGSGGTGIAQMSMDSKDNLYVAEGGGGPKAAVVMFPAGANGNVAPTVITSSTYSPAGVTLDAQDNIYITQSESTDGKSLAAVYVFPKGSASGATPTRTITGSSTGMFIYLNNIHVDSAGNIFVAEVADGHQAYLVYSATANGNVAPSSTLSPARGSTLDSQFYLK